MRKIIPKLLLNTLLICSPDIVYKIDFNDNHLSCDMTKPTMWLCTQRRLRSAWASTSLIRVFAIRMKKAWVLSYPLSAQRRLWSDWADAQADLSLCWGHSHLVGFVMSWLIFCGHYVDKPIRNIQYSVLAIPLHTNGNIWWKAYLCCN